MVHPRLPSMSRTESLVLELLRGRERYGLELVDASDGKLKRGSVYVTLARMEEKGFVDSRQEERAGGRQRPAAAAVSRHPVRPESPRRLRAAARGARPQAGGGAMSFESTCHRVCRALPVGSRLRADRRAGAGRLAVRRRSRAAQPAGQPPRGAPRRGRRAWRRPPARLRQRCSSWRCCPPATSCSRWRSASTPSRPGPSSSSWRRWCWCCRWCRCWCASGRSGRPVAAD